jgi:hypothetical protein
MMTCLTALGEIYALLTSAYSDHILSNEQFKVVWTAFMNRCSISMTEPDFTGWTREMKQAWKYLWESELNPF